MLTHRSKLLLIGALLTAALAATVLVSTPEATRTVDEVMDNPESIEGREIAIRGEVRDGSIDTVNNRFIIHGDHSELVIDFSNAQTSGGLEDNRTVYAEGILVEKNGEWIFEAEVIKTSCPSKYEEATEE
ncbi:MAG: cytochrome c maturation protein CcmE [Candidatus Poseidoniaceae archaeon]